MKTVSIITNNLECDELVGYFARLEKYFSLNGWQVTKELDADLVIITACGAIDMVHEHVKNALKDIKEIKGNFDSTVIMGCQVVTYHDQLREIFDGKMVKYGDEAILDELIQAEHTFESVSVPNIFNSPRQEKNDLFTIIISTGCLRRCTYCAISKAHGYIKSRPIEDICEEYATAVKNGFKNIAIAGTDTSVYGYDIDTDIVTLLKKLREIDSTTKLFIDNLHPTNLIDFEEDFIQMAKENAFAYFHIAFQHVNDEMLLRMGRKTDFKKVYEMIRKMKEACPSLIMFTDFIFGFPGESNEQFDELLDFVKTDNVFDWYYLHDYSDIPGTPSYRMTNKISEELKKERGLMISIAFERRKDDKISQMDQKNYRVFRHRYDIESQLGKEFPKGYYFCQNTYVELEQA